MILLCESAFDTSILELVATDIVLGDSGGKDPALLKLSKRDACVSIIIGELTNVEDVEDVVRERFLKEGLTSISESASSEMSSKGIN